MSREIIDIEFNLEEEKEVQFINWVSIIILWLGIGHCGWKGLIFETQVMVAIIFLIISTLLTYFNYTLGIKTTLGIIILGMLALIQFFPVSYYWFFSLNGFGIGIDFFLLGVGLIHYFTNEKELSKFLKNLFNHDISEEEIKKEETLKIKSFKRQFSNRSIEELEKIVMNNNLVPEARQAANDLLLEKEGLAKIKVFDIREKATYSMVVEKLGKNKFRMIDNDILNFKLTLGAEFETKLNTNGLHQILRITKPSIYITKRFMISKEFKQQKLKIVGEELVKRGGHWQTDMGGVVTINILQGMEEEIKEICKDLGLVLPDGNYGQEV